MGLGTVGAFGKAKLILLIIGFVMLFSTFIISVVSSVVYFIETGDAKPLLIETGGFFVGQDAIILNSVNELKKEDLSKEYTDYLKVRIVQALVMLVVSILLFNWIVKSLFSFGISKEQMNFFLKFLFIFIAIVVVTALGVLYKGIILNNWSLNPYTGITELFKNLGVLKNVGTDTIVKAFTNSTVV